MALGVSHCYGGSGGTPFSDCILPEMETAFIRGIIIRHGMFVDGLTIYYEPRNGNPRAITHGGLGGIEDYIPMNGDILVAIEGRAGAYVDQLTFVTIHHRYGPFDGLGGVPFRFEGLVAGFFGRAGSYIDQIGFFYRC